MKAESLAYLFELLVNLFGLDRVEVRRSASHDSLGGGEKNNRQSKALLPFS